MLYSSCISKYYVKLAHIGAKDLQSRYTASFGGALAVELDALSYVQVALGYDGSTESFRDVYRALCAYNEAFAQHEDQIM